MLCLDGEVQTSCPLASRPTMESEESMTTEQPNAPQEFGDTECIRATDLYWQLARAAQVRALVSMLSGVATLFHLAFVHFFLTEIIPVLDKKQHDGWFLLVFIVAFFGSGLIVSWLMTVFYCRPQVVCPRCAQSLWSCGTDNFKPRRMRIRSGVTCCPHCYLPIR